MGLFSCFKKGQKDKLVSFLSEADLAYTKAFQVKNVAGLEKYFTRKAVSKIMERVRFSEKAYSGLERYKHIDWKKINDNVYIKIVTYDNVKISKGVTAPVGDAFNEEWTLVTIDTGAQVDAVRRLT